VLEITLILTFSRITGRRDRKNTRTLAARSGVPRAELTCFSALSHLPCPLEFDGWPKVSARASLHSRQSQQRSQVMGKGNKVRKKEVKKPKQDKKAVKK
jgi:hypothetical protein